MEDIEVADEKADKTNDNMLQTELEARLDENLYNVVFNPNENSVNGTHNNENVVTNGVKSILNHLWFNRDFVVSLFFLLLSFLQVNI